ncbi:pentapeptide repeat-containing protein [Halanaerobacter jeridensis]|uniref:Uncharacterized protein YjbI with pentapeptide repeats n=1 Tax=Halanaerobacter jeridensis TaxID=706427 RepID=A0A938XUT4_9FIRM|nr:pentapeptide repeat-containing protein [Halanaerobacter jeridensis]MBM7558196.1 uncharacterized protein YjbI with pentapeptide repeats [Halanaerobacter jeridensis]
MFEKKAKEAKRLVKQKKKNYGQIYSEELEHFSRFFGDVEEKLIQGENNPPENFDYFEIENEEYIFTKIKDKAIGNESIFKKEDEIVSGKKFYGVEFDNCIFHNVIFKNCLFIGCKFDRCSTMPSEVIFKNCYFNRRRSKNVKQISAGDFEFNNFFTIFNDSQFVVDFINCELEYALFNDCEIISSKFKENNMKDMIFNNCKFAGIKISDCDMRNLKIVNLDFIEGFSIEDKKKTTKFNRETYLEEIDDSQENLNEIHKTYLLFAECFKKNNIIELYGEYFYLSKKIKLKSLNFLERIPAYFSYLSCGFGERPWYAMLISGIIIVLSAIMYMILGFEINGDITAYKLAFQSNNWVSLSVLINDFFECLYFSFNSYFGIGNYKIDLVGWSRVIFAIKRILGVVIMGLFISTLVRKMTR